MCVFLLLQVSGPFIISSYLWWMNDVISGQKKMQIYFSNTKSIDKKSNIQLQNYLLH